MHDMPGRIELLRQLMDNMTDNIFFKDRSSRFILMNEACAKWNGFGSPQEAVGKSDYDLFTEEFADAAHADEQTIMETGQPMLCKEEYAEWEDGHTKWVSTTKIPLRDEDGMVAGCIGIGRDITELKRKEAELEEANEKLRQANELIARDLQMAATLQHSFLPQSYPEYFASDGQRLLDFHHLYEAAMGIGGDYCAIYRIGEVSAGLLICDVMGHGVRSALVTGMIRTIADEFALGSPSAGGFLTTMNAHLHPMLQTKDAFIFATACYVIIDVQTGLLTGALAGHPVPFHMQPRLGIANLLQIDAGQCGPALAVTGDHAYETFSVQLRPGDRILLYTDGLCEAEDEASGEEFGTRALPAMLQKDGHLPLNELFPRIVKSAQVFCHQSRLEDDVCLLGFTLNGLADDGRS